MNVEFIAPHDHRWSELLAHTDHDLYHLPEYVSIAAEHEGGEPVGAMITDGWRTLLLPLVVRPVTIAAACQVPGCFDAVSPYGYPHPLVASAKGADDPANEAFFVAALSEIPAALRERQIVTAFIRLHPLLPFPVQEAAAVGEVVTHGETVAIDLTPGTDLRSAMRKNHTRWIRRGLTEGDRMTVGSSPEDIAEFVEIYTENMANVDARAYYYFSNRHFDALVKRLPDTIHVGFLEIDGERACAVMFSEVCGIMQYHLGGTRTRFRNKSPMVLLTYLVARWGQDRGDRLLHLGGGLGGREDSLFHFKAGFSPLRFPFRTWRIVANSDACREFDHMWEERTGARAQQIDFFPVYRARPPSRSDGAYTGSATATTEAGSGADHEPGAEPDPLVIVGAGSRGREVLRILSGNGGACRVAGFVDDSPSLRDTYVDGKPVLGGVTWLIGHCGDYQAVVAVDDGSLPSELTAELTRAGVCLASIHERMPVSSDA
jgi:hypothetical protein